MPPMRALTNGGSGPNPAVAQARALRLAASGVALILALSAHSATRAEPGAETPKAAEETASPHRSADDFCRVLTKAATDNELPIDFFTRLIWQESRFNPTAVSPKGALGVAQFMPGTAAERGLTDPFDPLLALRESASYLRELRATFGGNLGLAAAAYNAGPGRVETWLSGRGGLPGETHAYVRIITGHPADAWASPQPPPWQPSGTPESASCLELAKAATVGRRPRPALALSPAWGPWGVQLAGNWSEGRVLATYEQLRRKYDSVLRDRLPLILRARTPTARASKYIVRVSETSRANAESLCAKLRAVGGACMVLRNPRG